MSKPQAVIHVWREKLAETSVSYSLVVHSCIWAEVWVHRDRVWMSDKGHCLCFHGKCGLEQS